MLVLHTIYVISCFLAAFDQFQQWREWIKNGEDITMADIMMTALFVMCPIFNSILVLVWILPCIGKIVVFKGKQ